MIHINDNPICTSPLEYSLIREEATGKAFSSSTRPAARYWRLRCFQELPDGCTTVYGVGEVPPEYWGWQRWPVGGWDEGKL